MRKNRFGLIIGMACVVLTTLYHLAWRNGADHTTTSRPSLAIVSGSENKALEPIIAEWGRDNGIDISVTYKGSVDISRILEQGKAGAYDAVWPANSLWIALGDTQRVVKHDASILRSPVVLGVQRTIAQELGWIGRHDITIAQIKAAAQSGAFSLAMTSATQSNSGASAYFGILYAMAGNPDILSAEHLNDAQVQSEVAAFLAQVDRSSGSSGWLKDKLVESPDSIEAMFNYEALIIEANQALIRAGRDPLYAIYPADAISVADSPLGYVDKGDDAKERDFLALQAHLQSRAVQDQLIALGRRAGLIGLEAGGANTAIWNPDWGIDLARSIAPIPTPAPEVIAQALTMYQSELRKPSLTIWVLDVSGSMSGYPISQLKEAMRLLIDPETSALNLLQPTARDVTIVLPFSSHPAPARSVEGNDPRDLAQLDQWVQQLEAGGGTDLYAALSDAITLLEQYDQRGDLFAYLPAIVAMTDGASNTDQRGAFLRALSASRFGRDVPIHAIAFGAADETQLQELNDATLGRLFHAGDDLTSALRKARGYN